MALPRRTLSTRPVRLAGALLAMSMLVAGCTGDPDPAANDGTVASDDGGAAESDQDGSDGAGGSEDGASDGGGENAEARDSATVPADPYPVTPPPEGFEAPASCTGEGMHLVKPGTAATPDLPERAGETVRIELTGIEGEKAQLTAAIGDGEPRPVEDAAVGDTVSVDLWTISITSVCTDQDQVEFDLIN